MPEQNNVKQGARKIYIHGCGAPSREPYPSPTRLKMCEYIIHIYIHAHYCLNTKLKPYLMYYNDYNYNFTFLFYLYIVKTNFYIIQWNFFFHLQNSRSIIFSDKKIYINVFPLFSNFIKIKGRKRDDEIYFSLISMYFYIYLKTNHFFTFDDDYIYFTGNIFLQFLFFFYHFCSSQNKKIISGSWIIFI